MGNALLLSSMRYEVYTATAGVRACPCVCVHAYKKIHVSGNKARDQYPSVPFLCQKKWTHILSGEDKDDGARYFFFGGKRDDEIHIYAYQYEVGKRGEHRMLKGTYNTQ